MAKLDISSGLENLVEGKTIDKEAIQDIFIGFENLISNNRDPETGNLRGQIDGDNIREEGLDRRVFSGLYGTTHKSGQRVISTSGYKKHKILQLTTPVTDGRWSTGGSADASDSVTGGEGGDGYRTILFDWQPERFIAAIVRCSFQAHVQMRRPQEIRKIDNDVLDFGIRTQLLGPTGTTSPYPGLDLKILDIGCIYPYQRVSLNNAFSVFAQSGSGGDAGEYNQYRWDKSSSLRQSFHLFHVITSSETTLSGSKQSTMAVSEPNIIRCQLAWRQNKGAYTHTYDDGSTEVFPKEVLIDGFHMNVTLYGK